MVHAELKPAMGIIPVWTVALMRWPLAAEMEATLGGTPFQFHLEDLSGWGDPYS